MTTREPLVLKTEPSSNGLCIFTWSCEHGGLIFVRAMTQGIFDAPIWRMTIKDQLFRRRKKNWIFRHHPFKSFNSPLLVSFCLPLLINRCNSYCGWMVGLQSLCLNTCLFDKIISSRLQHLLPPCPLFAIDLCTSCLGSRLGCNHPVSRLSGVCIRHHCRLVWWLSWKYDYMFC